MYEGVPVVEYVVVDFGEHGVQTSLESESEQIVALRTERGRAQLAHLNSDVGLHKVHDNERVIGYARPFSIVVVRVAQISCG